MGRFTGCVWAAAAAALLVGCQQGPAVEFVSPRIVLHLGEPQIATIDAVRGPVQVERVGPLSARVYGTGVVRINGLHTVEVNLESIRLHGVTAASPSAGAPAGPRHVYVEPDNVLPAGVHLDRVGP